VLRKFEAYRKLPQIFQATQMHFAVSNAECLEAFVVYDFLTSHASSPKFGAVRTAGVTGRATLVTYFPKVR
jgi:hypothetical protein